MIKPFENPYLQLEDDQEVKDGSGLDTHFDNAEVSGKSRLRITQQKPCNLGDP